MFVAARFGQRVDAGPAQGRLFPVTVRGRPRPVDVPALAPRESDANPFATLAMREILPHAGSVMNMKMRGSPTTSAPSQGSRQMRHAMIHEPIFGARAE